MAKLLSSRFSTQPSVLESYVLPPERRPGVAPPFKAIPVIDLQGLDRDRTEVIRQIMKASQEYGFFQLTNHGVSSELMEDVLKVAEEFFKLPEEEQLKFYSDDPNQSCRLKTSVSYGDEKVHFWRVNLRHQCHPLENHVQHWPQNPVRYREVFGRYSVEVRNLGLQVLDLICEGLGLEVGYFRGEISQDQIMSLNHYPACPDPTRVLGLPKHSDPYTLTLLNQGHVLGLQVLKDDQWVTVEPISNAFVVNINHILQIISNGKLKSVDHRVVTNSNIVRITVVSVLTPSDDCLVKPPKLFVNEDNNRLYRDFIFKDFLTAYVTDTHEGKDPLERFMIRS